MPARSEPGRHVDSPRSAVASRGPSGRGPVISVRSFGNRTPRSIVYPNSDQARRDVIDPDVHDLGIEDLLDLVADQVVHRLDVEVLGQPALDVVDEGQLGGALVGLRQELLRLVEQPGILQRDAEAAGERGQQANVRLAERVLSLEVLDQEDAVDRSPVIIGTNRADFASSPATIGGCPYSRPARSGLDLRGAGRASR